MESAIGCGVKLDAISLTESVHSTKEFSLTSMTGAYRRVCQKTKDFEWELLQYTDANIPLTVTDLDIITKTDPTSIVGNVCANVNGDEKNPINCKQQPGSSENGSNVSTDNCKAEPDTQAGLQPHEDSSSSNAEEAQVALKLSFTLPASSYATMAVRELLKTSTSAAFHKTLNK